MGYATLAIIGQSCLGSVAVMLLLMNGVEALQMTQLFFVTIVCMSFNGAVLAQLSAKIMLNILLLSVFTSVVVILLNLF